jgi:hypothetical protein
VGRSISFRDVEERYQYSEETIFRYFCTVLKALTALISRYIKLPSIEISTAISSFTKNYTFFKDCIGAVDRTHIAAKVGVDETAAYRN